MTKLESIFYSAYAIYDYIVPRFVDDIWAASLSKDGKSARLEKELWTVLPDEEFDFIITIRCFNFFGYALFRRQVEETLKFINPHKFAKNGK